MQERDQQDDESGRSRRSRKSRRSMRSRSRCWSRSRGDVCVGSIKGEEGKEGKELLKMGNSTLIRVVNVSPGSMCYLL